MKIQDAPLPDAMAATGPAHIQAAVPRLPILVAVFMAAGGSGLLVAGVLGPGPAWARMWAVAGGLWALCKAATWWRGRRQAPLARHLGFLLLWPGMDVHGFLDPERRVPPPTVADWLRTLATTLLGTALVWGLAPHLPVGLAAVVVMAGAVFLLHCGVFRLAALAWRRAGVDAQPLMRMPAGAAGLGEFWGRRWNRAVPDLAALWILPPLRRRTRPAVALMTVFLLSGLVHDLVLSVPAGAGYGWPTLYFLLQGAGVLGERRWLRGRPWAQRLAVWLVVVVPLPLCFHPPFVERVWLPFLTAIGAT